MIKNCKVLLSNSACAVVDFDGEKVQIPPIKDAQPFVNVKRLENGAYIAVDENETVEEKPKRTKKKIREPKVEVEEAPIFDVTAVVE